MTWWNARCMSSQAQLATVWNFIFDDDEEYRTSLFPCFVFMTISFSLWHSELEMCVWMWRLSGNNGVHLNLIFQGIIIMDVVQ